MKREKMVMADDHVVQLLWTGGWDSTFRRLQLLIIYRMPVQPYYIIDPDRKSICHEMKAMQNIKMILFSKYPEVKPLLFSTKIIEKNEIKEKREISAAYKKIRERFPIGIQYKFLAGFASQYNLYNLELSLEKGRGQMDQTRIEFGNLLEEILIPAEVSGMKVYEVNKNTKQHVYEVFKYFRFPLRDIDKIQMQEIAKNNGFQSLMNVTWFCHRPFKNDKPCGVCTPCILTVKEGLGHRSPSLSLLMYNVRVILTKEQFAEYFSDIYAFFKSVMGRIYKKLIN